MVDGPDSAWRNRAPGPHAHGNTARQAMDGLWIEVCGQQKQSNDPGNNQHTAIRQLLGAADAQMAHHATFSTAPTHQLLGSANAETTAAKSTGRSGRQNAAPRRNMRREERVTVQGPVKEQQPDGMSHRGGVPHLRVSPRFFWRWRYHLLCGGGCLRVGFPHFGCRCLGRHEHHPQMAEQ